MTYPTMDEVNSATVEMLARWHRFLPSPGRSAAGEEDFQGALDRDCAILARIRRRFADVGGMTSTMSKRIGWAR